MTFQIKKYPPLLVIPFIAALAVSACGGSITGSDAKDSLSSTIKSPAAATSGIDLSLFTASALKSQNIVDCDLADGTKTKCYELVTTGVAKPDDAIGPFCPRSISDTADNAGLWLDGTSMYAADGNFFKSLPSIYGEQYPPADNWIMYGDDGAINVTETLEACQAAARPDVDPAYYGYCVECALADIEKDLSLTFLIPVTPQADSTTSQVSGTAGISLNGFQIAAQAPVRNILAAYTIAAFDRCGGHVNPNDGYHYHAATGADGCNSGGSESDGHTALIGYAMDGYAMHSFAAAEVDALDTCKGHEDETRGYHYHAASPELNQHIPCFSGKTIAFKRRGPPPGDRPPPKE